MDDLIKLKDDNSLLNKNIESFENLNQIIQNQSILI